MMRLHLASLLILVSSHIAAAQTPNTGAVPGANHHLGDNAFRAKFGRDPTLADEKLRMRTHFEAVRDLLAKRPATRPDLEAKRRHILELFDAYIAKGTTPKNAHLPWRTPVFIDDEGTICAVGFLIEQTAGHPVAEKIASEHRYSYLEEIAAAMPEVQAWIADSGLTLDELSLIQPGYEGPEIDHVVAWNPKKAKLPDGPYENAGIKGTIERGEMVGDWTRTDDAGHLLGSAHFKHGSATWTSFYPDGKKLAVGHYIKSQPAGEWKIFHPSGNLAAEGELEHGWRQGQWHFYYDTPAKTPIAVGSFSKADLVGTWRHYDSDGKLLATEKSIRNGWKRQDGVLGLFELDIVPGPDGVRHRVHEGNVAADSTRLDELVSADGKDRVYVRDLDHIFDAKGFQLKQKNGAWVSEDCHWGAERKRAAQAGDLSRLHELIRKDAFNSDENADECGRATPVGPERAARLTALLSSMRAVRAQSPDFVRALALGKADLADGTPPPSDELKEAMSQQDDLAKILAANMVWYVEWPHVDGLFVSLYPTLPGINDDRG
jgi:hypothetical protein